MKNEDFEKLKALCNENGFEIELTHENSCVAHIDTKKVKVTYGSGTWNDTDPDDDNYHGSMTFKFYIKNKKFLVNGAGEFLSSQLEKYLNEEIK